MKLILISGKAGHGKDTLAKFMKAELETTYKSVLIIHYGDLLKYICKQLFGWDGNKDEKGRTLLQYVGTDVIRKQKPDFWVGFIAEILTMFRDEWDFVLIPDTRFPNEIEFLDKCQFDVRHVRITRPGYSILTEEQQQHVSETALDNYKDIWYEADNSGTIEDLVHQAVLIGDALIELQKGE